MGLKRYVKKKRQQLKRIGRKIAPTVARIAPYKTAVLSGVATYFGTPAAGAAVGAVGGEISRYWGATAARSDGYSGRDARRKGRTVRKKAWIGAGAGVAAGTAAAALFGSPWTGSGLLSSASKQGVGAASTNAQAAASPSTKLTTSQALTSASKQMAAAGQLTGGNPTLMGAAAGTQAGAQIVPGTTLTVAEVLTAGGTLGGIAQALGVGAATGTRPPTMPDPDGGQTPGGGDGGAGSNPFNTINAPGPDGGSGRPMGMGWLIGGLALLALAK